MAVWVEDRNIIILRQFFFCFWSFFYIPDIILILYIFQTVFACSYPSFTLFHPRASLQMEEKDVTFEWKDKRG